MDLNPQKIFIKTWFKCVSYVIEIKKGIKLISLWSMSFSRKSVHVSLGKLKYSMRVGRLNTGLEGNLITEPCRNEGWTSLTPKVTMTTDDDVGDKQSMR